jgi:tetratricopeptide (TPR) repeat protein
MGRFNVNLTCALAVAALFAHSAAWGQPAQAQVGETQSEPAAAMLLGVVRGPDTRPVSGATVFLQAKDPPTLTVRTDSTGGYRFTSLRSGVYSLRAEMAGQGNATSAPFVLGLKESRTIDLTLEPGKTMEAQAASEKRPEFFDEPHFTVAGVTAITNMGGHGGDTIVRNREALAEATASLSKRSPVNSAADSSRAATEKSLREAAARQPEDFGTSYRLGRLLVEEAQAQDGIPYLERAFRLNPGDFDNAYELALAYSESEEFARARDHVLALLALQNKSQEENAELHHLLGDVDEKLGDPLEAVREYQLAAELNPSETNLFDWGTELLMHRTAEPAIEVFTKGTGSFPRSVRMRAGLGAAWYSLGSYDQAAQRFCEASDLNPDDPNPYLFMGKLQAAEIVESPAIVDRLARFARIEPQNALANYYYAVALWKRRRNSPEDPGDLDQIRSLLETAVHLDPKLGLAYLQLGIVYAEQGYLAKAVSAYQHAIEASPPLEQAHLRLAQAYHRTGEASKARAEMQQYEQISTEKTHEVERQRHDLQQFVYRMRDRTPALQPQ